MLTNQRGPHLGTCPRAVPTSLLSHARAQQTTMAALPRADAGGSCESTLESLEDNVNKLHDCPREEGREQPWCTKDIFGRVFSMPVRSLVDSDRRP